MAKNGFAEKIKAAKLGESSVALVLVPSKEFASASASVLRVLIEKDRAAVYATLNKPFEVLEAFFKKQGIDLKKVFFLDLVTLSAGEKAEEKEHCVFIASPNNLTEFSIALNEVVSHISGKKLVVIDSFNTLLLYNDAAVVMRFIHFLAGRLRQLGVRAVILAAKEETDEKMAAQLSQFVDKVIDLS